MRLVYNRNHFWSDHITCSSSPLVAAISSHGAPVGLPGGPLPEVCGNVRLVWFPAFFTCTTFCDGYFQNLEASRNRNACSLFFAKRHRPPCLIHQVLRARTVVDRLKPLEASCYLPILWNLSISLLKALKLGKWFFCFLKCVRNPLQHFSVHLMQIAQDDSSFENGVFRRSLLLGQIRSSKMSGVYGFIEVNHSKITKTT